MQEYEITYIVNPQLTEEARGEVDGAIDALLDKLSAVVSHAETPMRRRLFYPIAKQAAGFARTMNVSLKPETIQEVRETLKKQPGVMRTMIIATPRRAEATPAIFDELEKSATAPRPGAAVAAEKKPSKPVTMAEVEEKIEEALEEEVK